MKLPQVSMTVVASILLTGAILNLLGSGTLGSFPQKLAGYVTKGYGV